MMEFDEKKSSLSSKRLIHWKKNFILKFSPWQNARQSPHWDKEKCEINNEILGRELNDKRERLQRIELLLQEPMTT